jgi:hypothetical protein
MILCIDKKKKERANLLKRNPAKPHFISRLQYSGGIDIYSLSLFLDSVLHQISKTFYSLQFIGKILDSVWVLT